MFKSIALMKNLTIFFCQKIWTFLINEKSLSNKCILLQKADKKAAAADDSESDDDDEDQLQKFLDGEDIDTDENDESFKMNTSAEASDR